MNTTNNSTLKIVPKKLKTIKRVSGVFLSLLRIAFLISVAYIVLYPLLYMLVTSFSTAESLETSARVWIPGEITFDNFKFVIEVIKYPKALWSTFKYEIMSAILEIISCGVVAYGFARFKFPLKKIFTGILFATILIPSTMLIIPQSINFSHLDFLGILDLLGRLTGWEFRPDVTDTVWAFYLPSILASGLKSGIMIFIYIQFFKDLPSELEEAAWVDGAGSFKTFVRIIIPSSSVVILTVSVFSIVWHWNDYQTALMVLTDDLPLSLSLVNLPDTLSLFGFYLSGWQPQTIAYLMGSCLLFVVPPLILYMIVQNWFIESIDRVGITG